MSKVKPIIYRVEIKPGDEKQQEQLKNSFDRFFDAAIKAVPMHHRDNVITVRKLKK